MDQFQEAFINEARDLLESLESALLTLEGDFSDQAMIGEVFRVMHSLKGTASMFGFDKIGELTHDLENIYDLIRDGKLALSSAILTASLSALDLIHALLEDPNLQEQENASNYKTLLGEIKGIATGVVGIETENGDSSSRSDLGQDSSDVFTYLVQVTFDEEIFSTGSNPLFLIDDLLQLGKAFAYPNLKFTEEPNFENCYTSWTVVLETSEEVSEIEDVFMFVEDECQVSVERLAKEPVSKKPEALEKLDGWDGETFDKSELRKLVKEQAAESKKSTAKKEKKKVQESIRVESVQVDELMNLVSQLVTTQASINLLAENLGNHQLDEVSEQLDKITRQLRENAFGMSLIPLDNLFMRFRRLIRDTSNALDKPISFTTKGEDTKLDKKIIETLADPLMHILRNSLDHGIESKESRKAAGKSETGKIEVSAYYSGAFVHINVHDDGGGINPTKVRDKAIEKGIISPNDNLTEQEMQELIFAPGFSTAEEVTDLSGRGVGMDVVRQNIYSLRGEILLDSKVGVGTDLTLKLPLTLSIIDGLLVNVGGTKYVLPVLEVDRCVEYSAELIESSFNELLLLEGEQVPFINLRKEFDCDENPKDTVEVVFVWSQGRKIGLVVDGVIGENQAVLKPLGKYYKHNELFSGATILGDGTISLVIDPGRIISYFEKDLTTI